ncbi:MAG: hypothetical protein QM757_36230 [Paludibaculum sp.]
MAGQGDRYLHDVERALGSIRGRGGILQFAANGDWVVLAYAKILRAAAAPRLRKLADHRTAAGLTLGLDDAMAASLDLHGMVSSSGSPGLRFPCSGVYGQRFVFRQFLGAWQRDDERTFLESLGPRARSSLELLLGGRSWADFRTEIRPQEAWTGAVGYRLMDADRAAGTNGAGLPATPDRHGAGTSNGEVMVQFTDSRGINCGTGWFAFSLAAGAVGAGRVLVDNPELGTVLRLISACSVQGRAVE